MPSPGPRTHVAQVEPSQINEAAGVFRGYVWQNISMAVWVGTATLESMKEYEKGCAICRQRHPAGMSSVQIIVQGSTQLPDSATREELVRINDEYIDLVRALAVVIYGDGFWASAIRGLLTALNMRAFRKRDFELRTYSTLEAAAEWLPGEHAERTGVQVSSEDLLAALRSVVGSAETASGRA